MRRFGACRSARFAVGVCLRSSRSFLCGRYALPFGGALPNEVRQPAVRRKPVKTVQAFCASPFAGIRRERRCSESRTAHRAANAELWGDDCRPAERKQPASARPFHNRAPLCDAEPPLCRHGASCRAAGGVSPHRGGEAGLFGLFWQAFAKAEARPNAACRCAVCAGRKASGALARAPKPERTGRPAAGGTVCARAGPKAAVPPAPGGQMRKRKGQEQPPVLFCAYTPIRAGLPRPTYSVSARDGHQRPER